VCDGLVAAHCGCKRFEMLNAMYVTCFADHSIMPEVDPAVVEAFKKVKKDTSIDWNTLSIKLDAGGEVRRR
jgi:hypothetical protein